MEITEPTTFSALFHQVLKPAGQFGGSATKVLTRSFLRQSAYNCLFDFLQSFFQAGQDGALARGFSSASRIVNLSQRVALLADSGGKEILLHLTQFGMSLAGLDRSECCRDGVWAAKKGHLDCLMRLEMEGRFLGLHSPVRKVAGQARKAQAWEAAVAACEAGQAHVLLWLLSAGWPSSPGWPARVDVDTDPWYLHHAAQPQAVDDFFKLMWDERMLWTRRGYKWGERRWPRTELALYRHAVRNRDPACLVVLLQAGCRSEWICPLAAWEGREEHLVLAAQSGCPCGAHALYAAASRGGFPALEAAYRMVIKQQSLHGWTHGGERCKILLQCMEAAAEIGSVVCIRALEKHLHDQGVQSLTSNITETPLMSAARSAVRAGHEGCLPYILERERRLPLGCLSAIAARGRQLTCLKLLRKRGCTFDDFVVVAAVEGGCPDCLRYVLYSLPVPLTWDLYEALRQSAEPEKLFPIMFEKGIFQKSPQMWTVLQDLRFQGHPRCLKVGNIKSLKLLVDECGPPPKQFLSTAAAAAEGVSALAYVRDLGADWEEGTLQAARSVETLRYAREHGCPWGDAVLSCFVDGLDLFKYAHTHGCPHDASPFFRDLPLASFDVLRYVRDHMHPTWAEELGVAAVNQHLQLFNRGALTTCPQSPCLILDFRVPLFLVKHYSCTGLGYSAQLADAGRSRAAALAQCFYRAGKYTREGRGGRKAALWDSMARCPEEVRHRIASDAQLVLPCGV